MRPTKQRIIRISITIAFFLAFYWVEFSPWSSRALAAYNNGYGTFDMKSYNVESVTRVLMTMRPEGFRIYDLYLCGDYLFILAFGAFQLMLSMMLYKKLPHDLFYKLTLLIPILRGVFDLVENSLLLVILHSSSAIPVNAICISSIATRCKLTCIALWIILVLIGIIRRIMLPNRRQTD